jgi:hypothetical protein
LKTTSGRSDTSFAITTLRELQHYSYNTTDDNVLGMKRADVPLLDRSVVGLGFKDAARQEKLLLQLLVPLLAEMCGGDDQNTAFALGPSLGNHQPRFDGLP